MSEVNARRGPGSGDRGPDDTLAEYERELKDALSVAPSPEFEARVRQRIDEDRQATARVMWFPAAVFPTSVGRGLTTPALLVASLLLVAGAVVLLQRIAPDDPVRAPWKVELRPDVTLPSQVAIADRAAAGEATVTMTRRPRRPARASAPEVIVVNQMEAVRRLVAAVADGRLAVPAPPAGPIDAPAEMIIAPIVVEPMPVPTIEPDPVPPAPDIRKTK